LLEKLEIFNDPKFQFYSDSHSYVYLGDSGKPIQIFESVSGFISQFKVPFDSDRISGFVAKKRGVSKQDILNEWAATAKDGTDLGSAMHEWIELFYDGKNPSLPDPINEKKLYDRIINFKHLYNQRLNKFTSVGQEIRIFSRKWGIAGTLDKLFYLDPNYYVADWKSNKSFSDNDSSDGQRQRLLPPFDDLWDNSLTKYSLQVSTYRAILEDVAGFKTAGAFMGWIGPDKPKMYKALDLKDRVIDFLNENSYII
jgi:hypothetical protein